MGEFHPNDFFSDPAVANDTAGFVAELRRQGPVVRDQNHGAFMVTGYEEAMEVLAAKAASFSSCVAVTGPLPPLPFTPAGNIREQIQQHRREMPWTDHLATFDGAEHMAHRAILGQLLTHGRLKKNEDYVAGLVVRLVDDLIGRGGCEITREFAHALSTLVIADLLGVPEEDREDLIDLLGLPTTQMEGDAEHMAAPDPLAFLHDHFIAYLQERRKNPQDDMLTGLVQSRYRDGSEPDLHVLARLACFLFGAGQDTSARLIAFSFRTLGDRPDVQARVRSEPERIPDFIEEVLRLDTPVKTLSRLAVEPVTIGGTEIPAGAVVTVMVPGANRDPSHFADPADFDFDRPHVRDNISFSRGSHACIGAPLARMEVRLALEQFLKRTSAIRISETHHGPRGARRYDFEPTYLLSGLKGLHVEWDKA